RQLLTESMLLSLSAGLLGLLGGYAGIRAILSLSPGNIPRIGVDGSNVSLDWRVAAFTFALSVVMAILIGLIPALQSFNAQLGAAMNKSTRRSARALGHTKTQAVLLVMEISVAVVLLIGAGLLIRTFIAIRQVNPGFDTHNLLTMHMSLAGPQFQDSTVAQFVHDGVRRISALPGVELVATTDSLPLEPPGYLSFHVLGRPDGPTSQGAAISTRIS